jgi:TldD protein
MKYSIDQIKEMAQAVLRDLPCEYGEIRISSGSSTGISLSGDAVDSISSGDSAGGSVRILKNGSWGFSSFNDIGRLRHYAERAMESASALRPTEKSRVYPSEKRQGHFRTPCGKKAGDISIDEKFSLIRRYNDILKASEKIQSTRAVYHDSESQYLFANTEGSLLSYDRSYCGLSLSSIAKDGNLIQPFGNSISGYGGYELAENREAEAEHVARIAVDLLGASAPEGGKCPVIVDPKLAGVFIHEAFGHLSEADFIHENPRMRELMSLGREFGPAELNVYDDGAIPGLSGFIPFDDEGIMPERTALIRGGILTGRLHSRETSMKMNEAPTGNGRAINSMRQPLVRMTSTWIDNGPCSREDIFSAADEGIYALDVIGGQTNLEMFTFTSGYGYEIKNGRPGRMFRDIQLSGNVFSTLKNIAMIGNDMKMFGGLGAVAREARARCPYPSEGRTCS